MSLNRIRQEASIDANGKIVLGAASPGASAIIFSTSWDDSENLNTYIVDANDGGSTPTFPYVLSDSSGNYEVGTVSFELAGGVATTRQIWESNLADGGFAKGTTGLTFTIGPSAQSSIAVAPELTDADAAQNYGATGLAPQTFGQGAIAIGPGASAGQESVSVGGSTYGVQNVLVGSGSGSSGNWVDHGAVVVGAKASSVFGMSTLIGAKLSPQKPGVLALGNSSLPHRISFPVSMLIPAGVKTNILDLAGNTATIGGTYQNSSVMRGGMCERASARFFIQSSTLQDGSYARVVRVNPALYIFANRNTYPASGGEFVVGPTFTEEHSGVNAPTVTFTFEEDAPPFTRGWFAVTASAECRITGIIDIEYLAIDLADLAAPAIVPLAPLPPDIA